MNAMQRYQPHTAGNDFTIDVGDSLDDKTERLHKIVGENKRCLSNANINLLQWLIDVGDSINDNIKRLHKIVDDNITDSSNDDIKLLLKWLFENKINRLMNFGEKDIEVRLTLKEAFSKEITVRENNIVETRILSIPQQVRFKIDSKQATLTFESGYAPIEQTQHNCLKKHYVWSVISTTKSHLEITRFCYIGPLFQLALWKTPDVIRFNPNKLFTSPGDTSRT